MKKILSICFFSLIMILSSIMSVTVQAMPFYSLSPKNLKLVSEFYTTYSNSQEERKHNIRLAVNSINNTLVDVNAEFSFNRTVGVRSEQRGYKTAKIISKGKFIEGVGGGVCQVSTTLYNAVLLAGLKVIEYHPHSLTVSYIAPSFDAMVNSYTADLRFINNTNNPIILKAFCDGTTIRVKIYAERNEFTYIRESEEIETIPIPTPEYIIDEKGEYTDLFEGEQRVISFGKEGLKSKGYLVKKKGDRVISKKLIRQDVYNPITPIIVVGTIKRQEEVVVN